MLLVYWMYGPGMMVREEGCGGVVNITEGQKLECDAKMYYLPKEGMWIKELNYGTLLAAYELKVSNVCLFM